MKIETIVVGQLGTNCYVVSDEETRQCVVIDPGADSRKIINYIESNQLDCKAMFLTHAHFDHVMALEKVREATGAPFYMCRKDEDTCSVAPIKGFKFPEGALYYEEGDEISVSSMVFKVLETPGHSPGSVTIMCGEALFTGDTLFEGSCGRTDFTGGDMKQELASLKRLAELPGDYDVYPGHMGATRLSAEREYNPYMQMAKER